MEDRTCGSILWKIDISNKKLAIWLKFCSKQNAPWNITVKHEEERMTKTEFVIKKEAEI